MLWLSSASDDMVEAVADVIFAAATTGKIGDGEISVSQVETAIHIRTGERDEVAV